ncbi:hypothetical protein [Stenotrophomonas sp. MMGLT7]|uniref:hypothetical protein n=1 Tax=Stenotrophomonas sp. MMGLT7 TaxID=2901227 RepID=UPI001E3746C5|nr:hypothetical protein [Stenotrophomonas sp. MMGLT7]MCD7096929.1 hypothetical protein [Stenotrophomonas sp. MMGLT7]
MTAATLFWDLRYRPAGTDGAWKQQRFPVAAGVSVPALPRGEQYQAQIRAVAASGKCSAWVDCDFTVGNTNRVGAAALPNIANQQSMWDIDTSVTYAAVSPEDGTSTATISVSAGTLVIGSQRITYGASSATIDGTAGEQVRIYLYYEDPNLLGGTLPLHLTTDIVESASADGRVAISFLDLTFPAAGSSGSGGGGIGGGGGSGGAGSCVVVDSWLPCGRQAGDIGVGDVLQLCDPESEQPAVGIVEFAARRRVPCVEIETAGGVVLRCSRTAPIPVRDGYALAPDLLGRHVPTMQGGVIAWQAVTRVTDIGLQDVQHITVGDRCFWAGARPGAYILHHNAKQAQEVQIQ